MTGDGHLLDLERTARLCDVGAPDYVAAVAIEPDGREHSVLAKQSSIDDMDVRYDSSVAEATHEQLGSLPGFWNLRVRLAPMRCARMTLRGSPCHVIVLTPGAPCRGTPPLRGTDDRGVSARRLRTAARVLTVRGAHHPAPHQRRVGHHPPADGEVAREAGKHDR
ncbi:hypothetical protein [Mycolicibacterium psychrotolerans]|uniref:hypothetical protein n=1 Tax=Mycolicibacterium psychrotolerans TaxID=216929 RepID=UPI0015D3BF59|nr:hypothetical protein [Mycolicibacterium psychrotolerans]